MKYFNGLLAFALLVLLSACAPTYEIQVYQFNEKGEKVVREVFENEDELEANVKALPPGKYMIRTLRNGRIISKPYRITITPSLIKN